MRRVLLITVHFRNGSEIESFVREAAAALTPAGWSVEIVVVDNSGDAPSLEGVAVFPAPGNLGYLGAAAFGLDLWRATHDDDVPDWVGVVNADVSFAAAFFAELVAADLASAVLAVAPDILLGGVTPQNPFMVRRPSALRMFVYTIAFRSRILTAVLDALLSLSRIGRRTLPPARPQTIYAPHGSVMFFRRSFFERGGTLQYESFMFGEEIHIAEQVRAAGGSVMYVPAMQCTHRGGSTTSEVDRRQRRRWHLESAQFLWRKYFRRP